MAGVVAAAVGTACPAISSFLAVKESQGGTRKKRIGNSVSFRSSSALGTPLAVLLRRNCNLPLLSRTAAIRCIASEQRPKKSASEGVSPVANPASDDVSAIASNIKYHAEYTPTFAPLKFELPKAYAHRSKRSR